MISNLSVSLRCINLNDYVVASSHDGLMLEKLAIPVKEGALWSVIRGDSSYILRNEISAMRLTFDMKKKIVSNSEVKTEEFSKSLEVRNGDQKLLLQVSSNPSLDDQLGLELLTINEPQTKVSIIFFAPEASDQIFPYIGQDLFNASLSVTNTIANVANNDYDYVVVGSSFCSLAFIYRMLQNKPASKFLVLEKGLKYLPEHYQQCPSPCPPGQIEYRPWRISNTTKQGDFIENVHGPIPFFGGRSTYWSGWSPTPSAKELSGWPDELKSRLEESYFTQAHTFLEVAMANKMKVEENNNVFYGAFQNHLKKCLDSAININSVEEVFDAPLAMGNHRRIKFSTVEALLSIKNVTIIFDCTVEKLLHDGKKATHLQTNHKTILPLRNSKLVLAMSTLPATTLVLNSFNSNEFPQLANVGKRFTAHFVSSVLSRVSGKDFFQTNDATDIELGAVYITGRKEQAQHHLQLSAAAYRQCDNNSGIYEALKKYSANSIPQECIDTSEDFVVVSCSTLGELDYKNKTNQFYLTNSQDCLSANGELNIQFNDQDKQLWDLMDYVTYDVMKKMSSFSNGSDIEYWHEYDHTWRKNPPSSKQIRRKLLVHDASTMWIGDNKDLEAPVRLDYCLRGVSNVYITGGALWPTGGSWNPVLTITAMAMHLADTL